VKRILEAAWEAAQRRGDLVRLDDIWAALIDQEREWVPIFLALLREKCDGDIA
jgi:hypothetical protein